MSGHIRLVAPPFSSFFHFVLSVVVLFPCPADKLVQENDNGAKIGVAYHRQLDKYKINKIPHKHYLLFGS